MKRLPWLLLTIGFGLPLYGYGEALSKGPIATPGLKDPIELCDKLGGTERDICMHQARQNPAAPDANVGGTAATAGSGAVGGKSGDEKRGNTPPGMSRSGEPPAAGAIVDPAGVTKR